MLIGWLLLPASLLQANYYYCGRSSDDRDVTAIRRCVGRAKSRGIDENESRESAARREVEDRMHEILFT